MSAFDILLAVYAGILGLAVLLVVYRMIVGPTILDRAISSDSLVTLVVMGMALYAAHSEAAWAGPAMLGLTGLAFIGTVTFARFVAREDPMQGRRPHRHAEEPRTDTGPHEAIHVGPESGHEGIEEGEWGESADEPANTFDAAAEDDLLGMDDPAEDPAHPGEAVAGPGTLGRSVDTSGTGSTGGNGGAGSTGGATEHDADGEHHADGERDAHEERDEHEEREAHDGDETGFGAQSGSRGFEDQFGARRPEQPTEGER